MRFRVRRRRLDKPTTIASGGAERRVTVLGKLGRKLVLRPVRARRDHTYIGVATWPSLGQTRAVTIVESCASVRGQHCSSGLDPPPYRTTWCGQSTKSMICANHDYRASPHRYAAGLLRHQHLGMPGPRGCHQGGVVRVGTISESGSVRVCG